MGYTPNNPLVPGDPYSYDLKWMVEKIKEWKDPLDSAENAAASAAEAKESKNDAAASALAAASSAADSANSAFTSRSFAENIADPVSGLVTQWLSDNLTQDPSVVIDKSLTVEDAAADSKAVGKFLFDKMEANFFNLFDKTNLQNGGYYANGWQTNANYSATDYIDIIPGMTYVSVIYSGGSKIASNPIIEWYDSSKTYMNWSSSGTHQWTAPSNARYCRVSNQTNSLVQMAFLRVASMTDAPDYLPAFSIPLPSLHDFANATENPMKYASGNILCIGDSLTLGYYADQLVFQGAIKQNIPYYLSRMLDAEVRNEGQNGSAASIWRATHPGFDYTPYDTVMVWLGTNGGLDSSEISTPGTEAYNYNQLVQEIKAGNPKCRIILLKVFVTGQLHSELTWPTYQQTNTCIDAIATANSISYVVDLSDLRYAIHPELHTASDNNHFTKGGNIYVANVLVKYLKDTYNVTNVEFGLS